ncbi:MAG: CopG family transcriptional regulator [Planctomycetota bacterium]
MLRTQIYLTKQEQKALQVVARRRGTTQSQIIREAVDMFLDIHRKPVRVSTLRAAYGIWADHKDLDLRAIRSEFDRSFGAEK